MNRHVEALAEEFLGRGHDVRVLAPFDPPDRLSRLLHRAAAEPRELPDYLIPLGRTIGFGANGAVSNLSASPGRRGRRPSARAAPGRLRRRPRPRAGRAAGRLERRARRRAPGGRHLPRLLDQGDPQPHRHGPRRPPRLQPALGPDRRLRGRRLDRPALVRRPLRDHPQRGRRRRRSDRAEAGRARSCGSSSSAAPEERKGLPILLTAFGALVEHVPCRLTVIGAEREDVLRYLADPETMRWIDVHGRVSGERLWRYAARGRRALRALALRRELRHGPDRGLRRRHAGDRLGDRRLQRRRHRRRRRRARPARRPAAAGRGAAARPPRARAPARRWARRRARAPSATPGRGSPTG